MALNINNKLVNPQKWTIRVPVTSCWFLRFPSIDEKSFFSQRTKANILHTVDKPEVAKAIVVVMVVGGAGGVGVCMCVAGRGVKCTLLAKCFP